MNKPPIDAVADTGFVVALLNRRDKYHASTSSVFQRITRIYLPQPALTEIAYLLTNQLDEQAVAKFLRTLPQSKLQVISATEADLEQTANILTQYASSRIDFVDALVMSTAERLDIETVLTVDYRDFRLYRPHHCAYFTLLPEQIG